MDTSVWSPLTRGPRLEARKIVVTGAASGMGRAVAELFAKEGAQLTLIDSNEEGLRQVASGLKMLGVPADISLSDAVSIAIRQAESAMGGIDGVVNAAGILRVAPFADTDPELWQRVQEVNLFGPYLVCRAALPAMLRAPKGTIVNIASMGGINVPLNMSAYGASKAGLIALTKSLALELAPTIRANAICPGIIKTSMTDSLWSDLPEDTMNDIIRSRVGLQRKGTPMEIAYMSLFLSSDESAFVTGSINTIDGGPARG